MQLIFTPFKIISTLSSSPAFTIICPSVNDPFMLYVPDEVIVTLFFSTVTPFPSTVILSPSSINVSASPTLLLSPEDTLILESIVASEVVSV